MIGYTMFGSADVARARGFYDPLMALFGARVVEAYTSEDRVWYATAPGAPMLVITKPHDGGNASFGNGTMVALPAASRAAVAEIHAKALALGGADEGAPGVRTGAFYGAYFRDLDGNKLCAFTLAE